MADLSFQINGNTVNPPDNWGELEIEVIFNNNAPDATIKTSQLNWLGPEAGLINDWINKGLLSGLGITEGMPLGIFACNPPINVFNGCINATDKESLFRCDLVNASVIDTQRIQFMNDLASSIDFRFLASLGLITKANYVAVPDVISTIPDWLQVAMMIISFIQMYKTIGDGVQTFLNILDNLVAATTDAAATLGATIAAVVGWSLILLAYCIYLLALLALTIGVFLMVINEIIQPIKYKYGMRVVDLFTIGCSYFGLGFSSTILQSYPYKNLVHMPVKSAYLGNSTFVDSFILSLLGAAVARRYYDDTRNSNAYGYYEGTFAQFIQDYDVFFNATDQASGQTGIIVRNNVLNFERWDHFNNNAAFRMPPQSSEAPFDDPFGTNASEIFANYEVVFAQDTMDANTYDQYDGTQCMVTLAQKTTGNIRNSMLKGLAQRRINMALAKPKKTLSAPEQVANGILNVVADVYNPLVNTINSVMSLLGIGGSIPTLPYNILNNRLYSMLLSSDFTGQPKVMVVDVTGKLDPNNTRSDHMGWCDATYLMKTFHLPSLGVTDITWPDGTNTKLTPPNQYLTYKGKEIPLCCSDFALLRNNNIITSFQGDLGLVQSLAWNPHMETAKIDFRIQKLITKNLNATLIIDGQP